MCENQGWIPSFYTQNQEFTTKCKQCFLLATTFLDNFNYSYYNYYAFFKGSNQIQGNFYYKNNIKIINLIKKLHIILQILKFLLLVIIILDGL